MRKGTQTGEKRKGILPLLRLSGLGRVWVLNGVLIALATLLATRFVLPLRPLGEAGPPWWTIMALFALAEAFTVHFQLRREAHAFSLSEIPLVLGLFFLPGWEVLTAQLAGAGLAFLYRRVSPVKLAFNLAHFAFETSLAILVFHAVAPSDPAAPLGWLAAFTAVLTTTVIGSIAVTAAISLAEGRVQLATLPQGVGFGSVVGLADACLGLIAAVVLSRAPLALWLVTVPALIVFFAYRTYTVQRQKHRSLEELYESTRVLQGSLQVDSTMGALLARGREMFRAEVAEILLFPGPGEASGTRTSLGPGDTAIARTPEHLDPTEGVWARVAAEGQAILLPRPISAPRLREHFAERGIVDAMVAPLHGDGRVIGTLLVANRLGDVSTFDHEDLQLFETLANHASIALENARLVGRLEDSLAHLTEMNRLKDDFVATVSHELRTPLTSIQGSIKTLLRLKLSPEDQHSLLDAADRGSDRLRRLIEDLLMVSRIESRGVRPVLSDVSVAPVLDRVLEELEERVAGRVIVRELPSGLPAVRTDEGKVVQILSNLLDNALKYSPESSPLTIVARGGDSGVTLSLTNRGSEIPAGEQDRIFDRFYQVDQTSTREVGGAGLGLYICRRLAESIGGRVWLERSDHRGTVFSLFLPSTAPDAEPVSVDEYAPRPGLPAPR